MLRIRLQRTGRKNLATYRIVVAEHARPVKGSFLEILGHYLPMSKDSKFTVDSASVKKWVAKGAVPSDTMARLLKRNGVDGMDKFIKRYTKQKSKNPDETPAEAPAATEAAPAEAAAA